MYVSYATKAVLLVTGVFLTTFATPVVAANRPAAVTQPNAIARIEHVIVGGQERTMAVETEARITRAANNQVQPAKTGALLYANDRIATGSDVKLIIRCLNLPNENDSKVILYQHSEVRIVDNTSYTLSLGKIWFGIKGLFTVRTFYWVLGNRGTEFEVQVDVKGDTSLAVLDGTVTVSAADSESANPARRVPRPVEVKALEEVSLIAPATRPVRSRPLTRDRALSILSWTNQAFLISQPTHPARRVLPHFNSALERGQSFQTARFGALWNKEAASFEILGNVYSDWGEGAKALEAYMKALALDPSLENSVDLATGIGESYRLVAENDKAEQSLKKALNITEEWAPALNALGNVYFSKARAALRDQDLNSAKKFLQAANAAYERSFESIARARGATNLPGVEARSVPGNRHYPINEIGFGYIYINYDEVAERILKVNQSRPDVLNQSRGVTKVNIGDVKSIFGNIALLENKPEEAARLYDEAKQAYLQAKTFYPDYPYVEMGLNNVAQAIQTLPNPAPAPPQPGRVTPPTERDIEFKTNRLPLPVAKTVTPYEGESIANSLAAALSYVGDSDVEPCQIFLNPGCCERANKTRCFAFRPDLRAVEAAVDRFAQSFGVPAEVVPLMAYEDIVWHIRNDLPVVAIGDFGGIVISGYGPGGKLFIKDPSRPRETSVTYTALRGWRFAVRFYPPKQILSSYRSVRRSANAIAEMLQNEEFSDVAVKFRLSGGQLKSDWNSYTASLGPIVNRSVARVSLREGLFEATVKIRLEKGVFNVAMTFDATGTPIGLLIRPERTVF